MSPTVGLVSGFSGSLLWLQSVFIGCRSLQQRRTRDAPRSPAKFGPSVGNTHFIGVSIFINGFNVLHSPSRFNVIAVLTGAVRRSGRRSLNDRCAVSGQAPGSGAERRGQVLDEVSTAIHGGGAAVNKLITG